MRVYIAGPITGVIDYKEKFRKAEERIKEMGHIVINPAYLPDGLNNYMHICKAMIDQADAIVFLNGWRKSKGACEEYEYAIDTKKQIFEEVSLWG